MRAKLVTIIFPDGPFPANLVHVLVATEERTFIFVHVIITCLTCALVLESLDDVGEIGVALKRTSVLCVSTVVLLLTISRQDAKKVSKHTGTHSCLHRPVLVPSQAWVLSSKTPKRPSMPGYLQQILALPFPCSIMLWACLTTVCTISTLYRVLIRPSYNKHIRSCMSPQIATPTSPNGQVSSENISTRS